MCVTVPLSAADEHKSPQEGSIHLSAAKRTIGKTSSLPLQHFYSYSNWIGRQEWIEMHDMHDLFFK